MLLKANEDKMRKTDLFTPSSLILLFELLVLQQKKEEIIKNLDHENNLNR